MYYSSLIIFLLTVFIFTSWWAWSYGISWGVSPLIDYFPIISQSVAVGFHYFYGSKFLKPLLFILVPLFMCLNLFQTWQYKNELLHFDDMTRMEKEAMRFLNLLGNKFFSMIFSWLLDQRIEDTHCGTKIMFRKNYERLKTNRKYFGDFDTFGDFDLLFGAFKLNLCITELPVRYRERTYGRTNISRFRHGLL